MKYLFILIFSLMLQGCFSVATTGASAVYNRYSLQNNLSNQSITMTIDQAIKDDLKFKNSKIDITCFNYEVLLTGETNTKTLKNKAANIAARIENVKHVYNFIEIREPSSSSEELHDDWLTTKIKAKIIADAQMDPSNIKVVTENGTVYLLGNLTRDQAAIAIDIARYTDGVKRVVKIFNYISYSKT